MIPVAYLAIPALALAAASGAVSPYPQEGPIVPGRAVVIGGVTRGGRDPFPVDAVQKLIVMGQWRPPRVGDTVETPFGTRVFAAIETGSDGVFRHNSLRGGYASVAVTSGQARVMLLEARGHSVVYVNGEPRTGDPYGYGYVRLPVPLRQGENEILFACGRGELGVKLTPLRSEIMLDCADATLPDLVRGEGGDPWGAVVVINGTHSVARSLELVAKAASGRMVRSRLPAIPALGVRKVGFRIPGARVILAVHGRLVARERPIGSLQAEHQRLSSTRSSHIFPVLPVGQRGGAEPLIQGWHNPRSRKMQFASHWYFP